MYTKKNPRQIFTIYASLIDSSDNFLLVEGNSVTEPVEKLFLQKFISCDKFTKITIFGCYGKENVGDIYNRLKNKDKKVIVWVDNDYGSDEHLGSIDNNDLFKTDYYEMENYLTNLEIFLGFYSINCQEPFWEKHDSNASSIDSFKKLFSSKVKEDLKKYLIFSLVDNYINKLGLSTRYVTKNSNSELCKPNDLDNDISRFTDHKDVVQRMFGQQYYDEFEKKYKEFESYIDELDFKKINEIFRGKFLLYLFSQILISVRSSFCREKQNGDKHVCCDLTTSKSFNGGNRGFLLMLRLLEFKYFDMLPSSFPKLNSLVNRI